jgi:hypothetical protein
VRPEFLRGDTPQGYVYVDVDEVHRVIHRRARTPFRAALAAAALERCGEALPTDGAKIVGAPLAGRQAHAQL